MIEEEIKFDGHPNVLSSHPRTLEITKDASLTKRGDCIIGVNSTKSCYDLDERIKNKIQNTNSIINFEIIVNEFYFGIKGSGSINLLLTHKHDIVLRKTKFTCPRTIAVSCDKASSELPHGMIGLLQSPKTRGIMRISIE